MWENRCKVAVSGVGYSQVSRSADIPLAAHALTAVKEAVANSGLQMADIDGLATYPELPATGHAEVDGISIVSVNCMMAMLKLPNLTWHIQVGTHQYRRRRAAGGQRAARRSVQIRGRMAGDAQPARHLPKPAQRHGGRRGAVHRALRVWRAGPGDGGRLYPLARKEQPDPRQDGDARRHPAQAHPAQPARLFPRHAAGREDYFASRMVAYPFCLFDCDIPVQGAVAIVLTTAERARDLKPTPAYLAGYGQRLHFEVAGRIGSLSSYMEGGSSSAKLTWERSGFTPKDVDVAQIYDGFSASVIYGLESYGFCKEGEALDFIQDGRIELDGELPLNTFGGSLGTGRIHGLWHIIEGALQASGRAGSRQVKDVNVSFVGASAPIVTGTTFIFVREPY